jgi:Leucine-rich repeat (LRR) protein
VTAVVELDFSGHQQIANHELQHLPRFTSVVRLSLANTGVSVVPDFSGLLNLTELDLSETQITSLTGLQNCQSLRKLDLAGLQLDPASWQVIGANTGLESLNLSNTTLDSLSVLDLSSLKSLKNLDVHGTKLTESDITSLKAALPGCEVLLSPVVPTDKSM